MNKPIKVKLNISNAPSQGFSVIVAGEDMSNYIRNISFDAGVNKATTVTIEYINVEIESELLEVEA